MSDDPTEDGVLRPEELERNREQVRRLDGNRYVVTADDAAGAPPERADGTVYGVDLTVRVGAEADRTTVATDDVREAFDELVVAFAAAVEPDRPAEAALALLVDASAVVGGAPLE